MSVSNFKISIPDDFEDFFSEAKGFIERIFVSYNGNKYSFTFFDTARFFQNAEEEVSEKPAYFEKNLILVKKLNRENIISAIEYIINTDEIKDFLPE